jgi:hypothetical protein
MTTPSPTDRELLIEVAQQLRPFAEAYEATLKIHDVYPLGSDAFSILCATTLKPSEYGSARTTLARINKHLNG